MHGIGTDSQFGDTASHSIRAGISRGIYGEVSYQIYRPLGY